MIQCVDLVLFLTDYLQDEKDKIRFLSTCKQLLSIMFKLVLRTPVDIEKVIELPYKQCFTNIIVSNKSELRKLWPDVNKLCISSTYACDTIDEIPNTITELSIIFNTDTYYRNSSGHPKIPSTLTNLTELMMGHRYDQVLPNTLTNLTSLDMGSGYNQVLPNTFTNLTKLNMSEYYNKVLPSTLTNLTELMMGYNYNQVLPNTFTNLTSLIMGQCYDKVLPDTLTNLTKLKMNQDYNKVLPDTFTNLTKLSVPRFYETKIPPKIRNNPNLQVKYTSSQI